MRTKRILPQSTSQDYLLHCRISSLTTFLLGRIIVCTDTLRTSLTSVPAWSRRALVFDGQSSRRRWVISSAPFLGPLQRTCQNDPLFPGGVWVPNISS